MQLWWKAKQSRTVQNTRAPPRRPEKDTTMSSSAADESYYLDLSGWDNFTDKPGLDSDVESDPLTN